MYLKKYKGEDQENIKPVTTFKEKLMLDNYVNTIRS